MLRRALIAASESAVLRRLATEVPFARSVAMRFVAGEELDDALKASALLHTHGMAVSLDELGESVDDEATARRHAEATARTLDAFSATEIDAQVSVKPTALGLDVSEDLCLELVAGICERAGQHGTDVTVDMEGSAHTEATIDLVLALRKAGHDNVGVAVQSYLYRTPDDVAALNEVGASVRLTKGAYAEPPGIAHQDAHAVDVAYARLAGDLLRNGTYPRIATHDHRLINGTQRYAERLRLPKHALEFQMLYGVREPLQRQLVAEGWRVRIYVPFGSEWYPYFVRRLAERPANVAFFLRALIGGRG